MGKYSEWFEWKKLKRVLHILDCTTLIECFISLGALRKCKKDRKPSKNLPQFNLLIVKKLFYLI